MCSTIYLDKEETDTSDTLDCRAPSTPWIESPQSQKQIVFHTCIDALDTHAHEDMTCAAPPTCSMCSPLCHSRFMWLSRSTFIYIIPCSQVLFCRPNCLVSRRNYTHINRQAGHVVENTTAVMEWCVVCCRTRNNKGKHRRNRHSRQLL